MRMLLTPILHSLCSRHCLSPLLSYNQTLPRDGCWLGVHSHRSHTFCFLPPRSPASPGYCCLWLNLSGTPQPTCRAANPGRMRHTHPPHLAGRPPSTHPSPHASRPLLPREADLVSRFTLSLLSAHPSPTIVHLAFTFSATWLPSFTSATFVLSLSQSNFFCLLSPFK